MLREFDLWRQSTYYLAAYTEKNTLLLNHHSPERLLIELKIEHADLNALADKAVHAPYIDELLLRRLKKRRLQLRDRIFQLEYFLMPAEPA
ncbi:MAG: hypothetical protein JWP96_1785 [Polaromonas sp.]|nr:hypothetical protein [Polaromonas sp.]